MKLLLILAALTFSLSSYCNNDEKKGNTVLKTNDPVYREFSDPGVYLMLLTFFVCLTISPEEIG